MKKVLPILLIFILLGGCNQNQPIDPNPNEDNAPIDNPTGDDDNPSGGDHGGGDTNPPSGDDNPPSQDDDPSEEEKVILNTFDNFNIHTQLQQSFLDLDEDNLDNVVSFVDGTQELSHPQKAVLSFRSNKSKKEYYVDFSKDESFTSYETFKADNARAELTNLELATTYYWRVKSDTYTSEVSSFTTLDNGIRNIYIDGVSNARDIGGYLVNNNQKRIKQGLIYRTGRLNVSWKDEKEYQITEDGIKTMKEELGIKSEIDLRRTYDGESSHIQNSVLGNDVNYFDCHISYNAEDYFEVDKAGVKAMFLALTDLSNLPAFFHCDIGTDRTGANAFLLGALLGKSEIDLYKDYLFSNFGNIGGSRKLIDLHTRIDSLFTFDGDTLQEKAINYLEYIGIKEERITNFINYCLEDVSA